MFCIVIYEPNENKTIVFVFVWITSMPHLHIIYLYSGAPEITPSCWCGSCCLFFSFLCCVMCTIIVCLFVFVFLIFSHGGVSLFSICEFNCPSGIFRPLLNRAESRWYMYVYLDTLDLMSITCLFYIPKFSSKTYYIMNSVSEMCYLV